MQAAVARDSTVRTISLDVMNTGDLDVTQSWHRRPRFIRPERVIITVVDGRTVRIRVQGALVLKSGAASTEQSDTADWSVSGALSERLDKAPDWVRMLWDEAPAGILSWRTGTDAGEVQAL